MTTSWKRSYIPARFTIFLYTCRLETATLTRRVYLDAADAERLVDASILLLSPKKFAELFICQILKS
jgi:hypothetical protein